MGLGMRETGVVPAALAGIVVGRGVADGSSSSSRSAILVTLGLQSSTKGWLVGGSASSRLPSDGGPLPAEH